MSRPLISICIPAYKNATYVSRLLRSVAVQTFSNYEIIITDDSPGNEVQNVLTSFQQLPLRYVKNQPAEGMPANWNKGLLLANGEWIKMMHDDDWFDTPNALQVFADTAISSKASFIFSACKNVYAPSGKIVEEKLEGWRKDLLDGHHLNLFYLNVIGHPSTVMHRNDKSILYDTQFKWVVDIDFYIRYMQSHPGFTYIPEMLINIGTDEQQVSGKLYKNPSVEIPEYLTMLAKFPSDLLLKNEYVFHLAWNLIRRFKIKNIKEIIEHGYQGPLPDKLEEVIHYQNRFPRVIVKQPAWSEKIMRKCFRKLSDKESLS
jgi:glycosyltransferase involved in cell wall biosynthesis